MDEIYRDEIMEHFRNPRHFGKAPDEVGGDELLVSTRQTNASCGDEMEVWMVVKKKTKKIVDIGFSGVGCAVSMAFGSMLIEKVLSEKMSVEQIKNLEDEDLWELIGGNQVGISRLKCVRLSVKTLKEAVGEIVDGRW